MNRRLVILLAPLLLSAAPMQHLHRAPTAAAPLARMIHPADVALLDQAGQSHWLYTDLVKGRTAVISFVFTRCASTCPLLSAKLQRVQDQLPERMGRDIVFLSLSVDPSYDTPARLAAFARKFEAGKGWLFLTGANDQVTTALKSLGQSLGAAEAHSERLLILNDAHGISSGIDAVHASPQQITEAVRKVADHGLSRVQQSERYFSNLPLVSARGTPVRFYRDVLSDRVVVMTTMFTHCTDACPLIAAKLARAERLLPAEVRRNVRFVGVTNDPQRDTPALLAAFATRHGLDDRWTLLTGKPDNIAWVLYRLGLEGNPQDHSTAILIGNEQSGQWRRVAPTASPAELATMIAASARNRGER